MRVDSVLRRCLGPPGAWVPAGGALTAGVALAVAVFCVIFPSLLKPLPYPDADRIVTFILTSATATGPNGSEEHFNVWRAQSRLFDDVGAFRRVIWKLELGDERRDITVGRVTDGFFRVFGGVPILGRTFVPGDERPSAQATVVLSHGFWTRSFQADSQIVGNTIRLDGKSFTVIGVLAPEMEREEFNATGVAFAGGHPDAWVPFYINPVSADRAGYFVAFAKLKPGVTLTEAKSTLDVLAGQFRAAHSDLTPADGFTIDRFAVVALGKARLRLYILMSAAFFVLLIAVINITNLAVVRTMVVERDLRLRAALGANGLQLLIRMLREHLSIASLSVALGTGLGLWISRLIVAVDRGSIPRIANGPAPWVAVAAFALAIWIVAVVVPASTTLLTISRRGFSRTSPMVKAGGGPPRVGYIRALSVVFQTAASVLLLYGTAVLLGTFVALRAVDEGFDAANVVAMRMSFSGPRFAATRDMAAVIQNATAAANAVTGVEQTAVTCCMPLDRSLNLPFAIADRPITGAPHGVAGWVSASPSFFSALKIPVLRGRSFTDRDTAGTAATVVVNKTLADTYWPGGNAIGQRLTLGQGVGADFTDTPREIVGIVGDVRDVSLEQAPRAMVYVPTAQLPDALNAYINRLLTQHWVIRTRSGSAASVREIESALHKATGQDISRIRSMRDVVAQSTAARDSNALVMTLFGATALLLAFVGVYGIVSYSVEQRQQETAIRLALGEPSHHVRARILRDGLLFWSIGLAVGLAGPIALEKVFQQFVFGVPAFSVSLLAAVAAVITAVGVASAWEPAKRASQCSVASALRNL